MLDQPSIGRSKFFDWISEHREAPRESLETLSGMRIEDRSTSLTERVSAAWVTPIRDLTVEQVRLLTSQRCGLQWLAEPVCQFIAHNPMAVVTFYAGDLSVAAPRVFDELLAAAPAPARAVAQIPFDWTAQREASLADPEFRDDAIRFYNEIDDVVAAARALARGHS